MASDFTSDQYSHSIFIDPVVPSDITNTAHKLKSKSSFGHDEISTKLLKQHNSSNHSHCKPIIHNWHCTRSNENSKSHTSI